MTSAPGSPLATGWRNRALLLGAVGATLWVLGVILSPARAFQAYWFAWIYWTGLSLGGLSVLLMPYVSGGAWGVAVRRYASALAGSLPLAALLAVPALFGLRHIFPWAAGLPLGPHEAAWLRPGWFAVRLAIYFALLAPLPWVLPRSAQPERLSAAGLIAYVLVLLFASTDWLVSLEPHWSSTMQVVISMSWQFLAALAFCTALLLEEQPGVSEKILLDLGNLLLAFATFWIYVSFSQFLIIWAGNLPREISWYLRRRAGGWSYLTGAVAALQFFLPFALLLSRVNKLHRHRLGPIAGVILAASVLQVYWLVMPSFSPLGLALSWVDLAAFLGVGGFFLAALAEQLRRAPMPNLAEVARA